MSNFLFKKLDIEDVYEIEPFLYEDDRGYFLKDFEKEVFRNNGLDNFEIAEVDESYSKHGVLRGLHFQANNPQAKLVRVIKGEVYDVAVDLRKNSKTYKEWVGVYLNDKKKNLLFVPPGFAHGFLVISDEAYFTYKCVGEYDKSSDGGINYLDKDINVIWPFEKIKKITISEKDANLPALSEIESNLNF